MKVCPLCHTEYDDRIAPNRNRVKYSLSKVKICNDDPYVYIHND